MRILFVGDIVGKPGRECLRRFIPVLRKKTGLDLVIANGENAAGGFGLTERVFNEIVAAGVDVITGGNHIWDRKEIFDFIDREPRLIRPANYPLETTPGKGSVLVDCAGTAVAVLNLNGRIFMEPYDCPFRCADRELAHLRQKAKVIIVDFHAEATSEKQALGWYLDGRVSAVIGTHTHVQTADARLLKNNTAYISDAGMTGLYESILGVDCEGPLKRFLTMLPARLEISAGGTLFNAVLIDIEENSGKATAIERVWEINI